MSKRINFLGTVTANQIITGNSKNIISWFIESDIQADVEFIYAIESVFQTLREGVVYFENESENPLNGIKIITNGAFIDFTAQENGLERIR